MTAVAASPAAIDALSAVLHEGSGLYQRSANELREAVDRFAATRSEFGPAGSDVPELLEQEARRTAAMAEHLAAFHRALQAADEAGAALTIGRSLRMADPDVLLVDSAALALFAPLDAGLTIRDLIATTEADLAYHDHHQPPPPSARDVARRWRAERARLVTRLEQYRALVDPPHPGGWAAADTRWVGAAEFFDAVEETSAALRARLLPAGNGGTTPPRWQHDEAVADAVGSDRVFLRAALDRDALLTPERLAVIDDLDDLATMPLDEFLQARATARTERPHLDWTADGCSGPIPPAARHACLRHDFLYRNARMLRDQWGMPAEFALDIKDRADDRFGRELYDPYSAWELGLDPLLVTWLEAAALAVSRFGDVSEPWQPPPDGAFYGSAEPTG